MTEEFNEYDMFQDDDVEEQTDQLPRRRAWPEYFANFPHYDHDLYQPRVLPPRSVRTPQDIRAHIEGTARRRGNKASILAAGKRNHQYYEEEADRISEAIERNLEDAEKLKKELSKRAFDRAMNLLNGRNRQLLVNRLTDEESSTGGPALRRIVLDNGSMRTEIVAPETL